MKKLRKKTISLAILSLGIFLSSCSLAVHPINVPSVSDVRAHWIKKGEKAPFGGILLNAKTYKLLRSKIIECEYQLKMCTQR